MKMLKTLRFCAALMTAAAAVPVTPVTVFAEDEAPTSGKCGENLTWEFDEATGTLTISGTGEMDDWGDSEDGEWQPMPWAELRGNLKKAVISEGVTSIGESAFNMCLSLKSVSMPESLTSIGKLAFCCCTHLPSIEIPDSVASIGESAFNQCGLESVTLPKSLTVIENGAFNYGENLKSITIPEGVETIKSDAMSFNYVLESIEIPKSVTKIEDNVFWGSHHLKKVTILNPDCEIEGNPFNTLCSVIPEYAVVCTICGYDNSTAEKWAKENGASFESLGAASEKPPLKPTKLGDIDLSNIVDVSDAVILARYLVGDDSITIPDQGLANADADGSGKLSTEDVNYIIKMIVGLV